MKSAFENSVKDKLSVWLKKQVQLVKNYRPCCCLFII